MSKTHLSMILPTKYNISNAIRIYGFYLLINSDVSATPVSNLNTIQRNRIESIIRNY